MTLEELMDTFGEKQTFFWSDGFAEPKTTAAHRARIDEMFKQDIVPLKQDVRENKRQKVKIKTRRKKDGKK